MKMANNSKKELLESKRMVKQNKKKINKIQ